MFERRMGIIQFSEELVHREKEAFIEILKVLGENGLVVLGIHVDYENFSREVISYKFYWDRFPIILEGQCIPVYTPTITNHYDGVNGRIDCRIYELNGIQLGAVAVREEENGKKDII